MILRKRPNILERKNTHNVTETDRHYLIITFLFPHFITNRIKDWPYQQSKPLLFSSQNPFVVLKPESQRCPGTVSFRGGGGRSSTAWIFRPCPIPKKLTCSPSMTASLIARSLSVCSEFPPAKVRAVKKSIFTFFEIKCHLFVCLILK